MLGWLPNDWIICAIRRPVVFDHLVLEGHANQFALGERSSAARCRAGVSKWWEE